MGKRPKKKIVLFLVEGKSDRKALEMAINELYDQIDENIEIYFPVIRRENKEKGGDITSTRYTNKAGKTFWIHPNNIEEAIYTLFLEDFFDKEKILPKDITGIVQIVDTDGAFISDDQIIEDTTLPEEDSPYYNDNVIVCLNKESITNRNSQKSENLNYLSNCSTIKVKQKKVPYSVYYFSCNLDHFLHHAANLESLNKVAYADEFSNRYIGDVEGFVKVISEDPDAVQNMNYQESWDYIKEEKNSLKRHTNLNVLLNQLLDDSKN